MRLDMIILFVMFVFPVMLFQVAGGSGGAQAQSTSTYAVSARVPATCPRGYSPNVDTGLCPVSCPSNTAANTNGECVPLPVVMEDPYPLTPKSIDAPTALDPANSMTCTNGRSWDAVLMRCE